MEIQQKPSQDIVFIVLTGLRFYSAEEITAGFGDYGANPPVSTPGQCFIALGG